MINRGSILAVVMFSAGCAHQPVVEPETLSVKPMPEPTPPAAPQLAVRESVPTDAAGYQELEAVLRDARVTFDFDAATLSASGQDTLQKVSRVLRKHPQLRVMIEGNCDERGTEEYNLALGQRRAESARRYLRDLGVAESQLDTISYGDQRPVDPAHTPDAWAQNRRDELKPLHD